MRWGFLALCGSLALSNPALAGITVEQYQQSFETLKKVETVSELDRAAYMSAHRSELEAATHIQEQAAAVYETLLEANDASFEHYGRNLLCNFSEEDQPVTFKQLADEYVTELHDVRKLTAEQITERVRYTNFAEMLVDKMLTHFECPANMPTGPGAVSTLDQSPVR